MLRKSRYTKDLARWANYSRPHPSHRHSGPSSPWPWIDLHDDVDQVQLVSELPPIPETCDHTTDCHCWKGYPQSRFPNWTRSQVQRSGLQKAIDSENAQNPCIVYYMDMKTNGLFKDGGFVLNEDEESHDDFWRRLISMQRPEGTRLRATFVRNMSGPTLQMLGAKYNIEPFFFSSAISWIPSRFQEEVRPGKGDHITVILSFLRVVQWSDSSEISHLISDRTIVEEELDTQRPLYLGSGFGCCMVLDLLAVHLIRDERNSTIISFHHTDPDTTSADYLHERIRYAGQSVYWQSIFQESPDPTFLVLIFLWHVMYSWDEALDILYRYIIEMEKSIMEDSDMDKTRRLHHIRAHHLHYQTLIEDLKKSVRFVLSTPNPSMDSPHVSPEKKTFSRKLLEKECNHLLIEVERLEMQLHMQDQRLKNVVNLVFSTVNIDDSARMKALSEAAVRDSAAMKQIAYLTMVFLPASYIASVFGMNVKELQNGSASGVWLYIAVALPMTFATIWIIMTFQSKYFFPDRAQATFWHRMGWPILVIRTMLGLDRKKPENRDDDPFHLAYVDSGRKQRMVEV